jgi:hypothetical protein
LKEGADQWQTQYAQTPDRLVNAAFERILGRTPTRKEQRVALSVVGEQPTTESVQDFLWALVLLPEFQLIF